MSLQVSAESAVFRPSGWGNRPALIFGAGDGPRVYPPYPSGARPRLDVTRARHRRVPDTGPTADRYRIPVRHPVPDACGRLALRRGTLLVDGDRAGCRAGYQAGPDTGATRRRRSGRMPAEDCTDTGPDNGPDIGPDNGDEMPDTERDTGSRSLDSGLVPRSVGPVSV